MKTKTIKAWIQVSKKRRLDWNIHLAVYKTKKKAKNLCIKLDKVIPCKITF